MLLAWISFMEKFLNSRLIFKTFRPNSNLVRPWILYPPHPMRVLLSLQSIATPLLVVQVQWQEPANHPGQTDRLDNIVIFGLPEGGSLSDLKNSVDELFTFLVGNSIPLRDLFRVGHHQKPMDSPISTCPHPVLVKLTSSWDRRLVMSIVRKIKDCI